MSTRTGAKIIGLWPSLSPKTAHLRIDEGPLYHVPIASLKGQAKLGTIVDFTFEKAFFPQKAVRKPNGEIERFTDKAGNPIVANYKVLKGFAVVSIKPPVEIIDLDPDDYEEAL